MRILASAAMFTWKGTGGMLRWPTIATCHSDGMQAAGSAIPRTRRPSTIIARDVAYDG